MIIIIITITLSFILVFYCIKLSRDCIHRFVLYTLPFIIIIIIIVIIIIIIIIIIVIIVIITTITFRLPVSYCGCAVFSGQSCLVSVLHKRT